MPSVKYFEVHTQMAAHGILCFEPNTLRITFTAMLSRLKHTWTWPVTVVHYKSVFLIRDNAAHICQTVTKTTGHFTTLQHFVSFLSYWPFLSNMFASCPRDRHVSLDCWLCVHRVSGVLVTKLCLRSSIGCRTGHVGLSLWYSIAVFRMWSNITHQMQQYNQWAILLGLLFSSTELRLALANQQLCLHVGPPVLHQLANVRAICGSRKFMPCSQESANCHCPDLEECSPS